MPLLSEWGQQPGSNAPSCLFVHRSLHTGDVQATSLLFRGAGTCHIPSNNKFNGQHLALLHNGHVWIRCAEQRILGDMSCVLHPPGTSLIEHLTLQVDAQPSHRNPTEWFCVSQTFLVHRKHCTPSHKYLAVPQLTDVTLSVPKF